MNELSKQPQLDRDKAASLQNKEIKHDIDRWAEDRLQQWFLDVLARYAMANIPFKRNHSNISALIIDLAAKFMAALSNISPEDAGKLFEDIVARQRAELRKEKAG